MICEYKKLCFSGYLTTNYAIFFFYFSIQNFELAPLPSKKQQYQYNHINYSAKLGRLREETLQLYLKEISETNAERPRQAFVSN